MKKFLIGCGVLTGVVLLALAGASFFAVRWVKDNAPDLERREQLELEMVERFGTPYEYTPPVDGDYSADRVRLYARIRTDLHQLSAPLRARIEAEIRGEDPSSGGISGWFGRIRKGAGYFRDAFHYLADADSVLLAHDMGRGEYVHLTGFLVRGLLAVDPTEFLDLEAPDEELSAFEEIAVEFEKETRQVVLDQWRNVLTADASAAEVTEEAEAWRSAVDQQLALTRREEVPWPFFGAEPPASLEAVFIRPRSFASLTSVSSPGGATSPRSTRDK